MPPSRGATGSNAVGRPIVCFSIFDWWYHTHGHSDTQLMLECARTRDVLFVNSIGMRVPPVRGDRSFGARVRRKLASTVRGLRTPVDSARLHVLSAATVPAYANRIGRQANTALVAAQVRVALARLRMRDPMYVVTVPTAWPVVRALGATHVVYNRADEHATFEEADQAYLRQLEGALLSDAQAVLYYNRALYERERAALDGRAVFVGHGVDLDAFHPACPPCEPDPLAGIPRPRVGFLGSLRDRVIDFDLVARVARELPDVQVVLAGPALSPIDALMAQPNVHWTGPRPFDAMPALMRAIDVGMLPYLDTPWTRSANPVKLKEYLAAGLPVVSTDIPAARERAPIIDVATTPAAFVASVRAALARPRTPDDIASRRASVADGSWAAKAQTLLALCDTPPIPGALIAGT